MSEKEKPNKGGLKKKKSKSKEGKSKEAKAKKAAAKPPSLAPVEEPKKKKSKKKKKKGKKSKKSADDDQSPVAPAPTVPEQAAQEAEPEAPTVNIPPEKAPEAEGSPVGVSAPYSGFQAPPAATTLLGQAPARVSPPLDPKPVYGAASTPGTRPIVWSSKFIASVPSPLPALETPQPRHATPSPPATILDSAGKVSFADAPQYSPSPVLQHQARAIQSPVSVPQTSPLPGPYEQQYRIPSTSTEVPQTASNLQPMQQESYREQGEVYYNEPYNVISDTSVWRQHPVYEIDQIEYPVTQDALWQSEYSSPLASTPELVWQSRGNEYTVIWAPEQRQSIPSQSIIVSNRLWEPGQDIILEEATFPQTETFIRAPANPSRASMAHSEQMPVEYATVCTEPQFGWRQPGTTYLAPTALQTRPVVQTRPLRPVFVRPAQRQTWVGDTSTRPIASSVNRPAWSQQQLPSTPEVASYQEMIGGPFWSRSATSLLEQRRPQPLRSQTILRPRISNIQVQPQVHRAAHQPIQQPARIKHAKIVQPPWKSVFTPPLPLSPEPGYLSLPRLSVPYRMGTPIVPPTVSQAREAAYIELTSPLLNVVPPPAPIRTPVRTPIRTPIRTPLYTGSGATTPYQRSVTPPRERELRVIRSPQPGHSFTSIPLYGDDISQGTTSPLMEVQDTDWLDAQSSRCSPPTPAEGYYTPRQQQEYMDQSIYTTPGTPYSPSVMQESSSYEGLSETSLYASTESSPRSDVTGRHTPSTERVDIESHEFIAQFKPVKPAVPTVSKRELSPDVLDNYGSPSLNTESRMTAAVRRLRFAAKMADNLRSASHAVRQLEYLTEEEQNKRDRVSADLLRRAALASQEAHAASISLVEAKAAADRARQDTSGDYDSVLESQTIRSMPRAFSVEWHGDSQTFSYMATNNEIPKHNDAEQETSQFAFGVSVAREESRWNTVGASEEGRTEALAKSSPPKREEAETFQCTNCHEVLSAEEAFMQSPQGKEHGERKPFCDRCYLETCFRQTKVGSKESESPLKSEIAGSTAQVASPPQVGGIFAGKEVEEGLAEEANETKYYTAPENIVSSPEDQYRTAAESFLPTPGTVTKPLRATESLPLGHTPVRNLQDISMDIERRVLSLGDIHRPAVTGGAIVDSGVALSGTVLGGEADQLINVTTPVPQHALEAAPLEVLRDVHDEAPKQAESSHASEEHIHNAADAATEAEEALMNLESTVTLYPESAMVCILAIFCLVWICFLLWSTSVHHKPDFTSETPSNVTKQTQTTSVNLSTSTSPGYTGTSPGAQSTATPTPSPYICNTTFCIVEANYLKSILGTEPCRNFYDYACLKVDDSRTPHFGVSISADTLLVRDLNRRALNHIRNKTILDMQITRDMLNDCESSIPLASALEMDRLLRSYQPSSGSFQTRTVNANDAWTTAGRIMKDFGIAAFIKVTVVPNPTVPGADVITIDPPDLLFMEGDGNPVLQKIGQSMENFLVFMNFTSNKDYVVQSVVDMSSALAPARPKKHQERTAFVPITNLPPGVLTMLQTFYSKSLPPSVLFRFENFLGPITQAVDQNPGAAVNYLLYRVLLFYAPYLNNAELAELFPLTFEEPPAQLAEECSRLVERVMPVVYMRALHIELGSLTLSKFWALQVESKFIQAIPRMSWLYQYAGGPDTVDAQMAKSKIQQTRVSHFFPRRATHSTQWTNYYNDLTNVISKAMGPLERVRAASQFHGRRDYSALAVEVCPELCAVLPNPQVLLRAYWSPQRQCSTKL